MIRPRKTEAVNRARRRLQSANDFNDPNKALGCVNIRTALAAFLRSVGLEEADRSEDDKDVESNPSSEGDRTSHEDGETR